MAPVPSRADTIVSRIDAHHERGREPPRPHMGCSLLGHPCDRYLWLKFRWFLVDNHPGRMLRLFRRGHMEEATILKDLRAVGCVIRETPDGQHRVDFGGHVSGSVDAVIESGVPEAPKKPHIAEFKTHSKKSFDELERDGVQKAKPMHYTQMQVYMKGLGIDRALYLAVCKDDDRLYAERVRYDAEHADKAVARGQRLAIVDEQPPRLSDDPSWYQCKMCDAHAVCHQGLGVTAPDTCRTCAHSTAKPDGSWRCERHDYEPITLSQQRTGCADWELHDDMMPF